MTSPHTFPIRIYYEDTDFSGNVYHAAYLKFMERARTEFLRERDVHHSQMLAEERLMFAVRSMEIFYDRPAHIDDALVVSTGVELIKGARMVLSQLVQRESETLVRASVTIAAISLEGRPVRLPQSIVASLKGD